MIDPRTENACDEVDAMVFSGDALHDQETLDKFKYFMGRWIREMHKIQILINERENKQFKHTPHETTNQKGAKDKQI